VRFPPKHDIQRTSAFAPVQTFALLTGCSTNVYRAGPRGLSRSDHEEHEADLTQRDRMSGARQELAVRCKLSDRSHIVDDVGDNENDRGNNPGLGPDEQ